MRPDASSRRLRNIVILLVAVAIGVFAFKVLALGFPLQVKPGAESWDVEAKIVLAARGQPVKVVLRLPSDSAAFVVHDEAFISHNFGLTINTSGGNRQALWSVRKASGQQILYYRAVVRQLPIAASRREPAPSVPEQPGFSEAKLVAAQSLIKAAQARSADLETFVPQLLRRLHDRQDGRARVLLGSNPTARKRADIAARLLTLAGHPTAIVHGLLLKQQERDAAPVEWLRVQDGKGWQWFNARSGAMGQPRNFLPWWSGADPLVTVSGAGRVKTSLALIRTEETALGGATERGRRIAPRLFALSLFSLPIDMQLVYRVILVVPIGVFVLVLLRNLVGLKTFGTFMPVLIALAFRQTELVWGLILFSVLVALGLLARFYLERLKLLLVPRLAAVLIIVVLLMAAMSVVSHLWGLPQGLSVALFPMVILTMTIERMSIVWEERGAGEAIQEGAGSLAAASLAYLVMNLPWLQHLVFVFPELLLLVLAAVMLMGRYSGYRLSELYRFKALSKDGR